MKGKKAKQRVAKFEGDGNWQPTLYVNPANRVSFEDWNVDAEIDLSKPPVQWLESFGQWLLPYAMGFNLESGDIEQRTLIELSWPWVHGDIWRQDVEVGEPAKHPFEVDLTLDYEEGRRCLRARYDLRAMILSEAEHCKDDGSYLDQMKTTQAALRRLADDLQEAIDAGERAPE